MFQLKQYTSWQIKTNIINVFNNFTACNNIFAFFELNVLLCTVELIKGNEETSFQFSGFIFVFFCMSKLKNLVE